MEVELEMVVLLADLVIELDGSIGLVYVEDVNVVVVILLVVEVEEVVDEVEM